MKDKKTSPQHAASIEHTSAGPGGMSMTPPIYGIESLDRATPLEAVPEPRQEPVLGAPLQMKADISTAGGNDRPGSRNRTGLPNALKTGVESLSGLSLNDVRVHYNSSRPAQLQALAYTQGTDIHVAPGQERHLPHEAWHVVQQKQGLVKPMLKSKDRIPLNTDPVLEKKADFMGARAANIGLSGMVAPAQLATEKFPNVVQRVPVTADYETVVGTEVGAISRPRRVKKYEEEKAAYDKEHGEGMAEEKIDSALEAIFHGLPTPQTFDRDHTNWEDVIDRLFRNVLLHGVENWSYIAGGTDSKPVLLYSSGNCGEFAGVFIHAVNLLAKWLDVRTLKAVGVSLPEQQLTPIISTVTRKAAPGIGPNNAMTGANRPIGNIFAEVHTDTDPINTGYAGVNRAYFPSHAWAKVTMPNGDTKEYDLLMRVDAKSIHPTPTSGDGHRYEALRDETGELIKPLPTGFGGGYYRISNAVWNDTIQPLVATADVLADTGLSAQQASQYMAPTMIGTLSPEDKALTRNYMLRLQAIKFRYSADMITLAQQTLQGNRIARKLWPHLDNAKNTTEQMLRLMLNLSK